MIGSGQISFADETFESKSKISKSSLKRID